MASEIDAAKSSNKSHNNAMDDIGALGLGVHEW